MRVAPAFELTAKERATRTRWSRGCSVQARCVQGGRIMLLAAGGKQNKQIAEERIITPRTVGMRRPCFADRRVAVEKDLPCGGRAPRRRLAIESEILRESSRRAGSRTPRYAGCATRLGVSVQGVAAPRSARSIRTPEGRAALASGVRKQRFEEEHGIELHPKESPDQAGDFVDGKKQTYEFLGPLDEGTPHSADEVLQSLYRKVRRLDSSGPRRPDFIVVDFENLSVEAGVKIREYLDRIEPGIRSRVYTQGQ